MPGSSSEDEGNPLDGMWLEGDSLAPPCQSDYDVVQKVVEIAQLTPEDTIIDLGCGDGRICIEAALKYGARARGIEIEPDLIAAFHASVAKHKLEHLVSVEEADLMEGDFSDATVIVTYLLPEALSQLTPKLVDLLRKSPKLRVICNTWGLDNVTPVAKHESGPYNNVDLLVYTSKSVV